MRKILLSGEEEYKKESIRIWLYNLNKDKNQMAVYHLCVE